MLKQIVRNLKLQKPQVFPNRGLNRTLKTLEYNKPWNPQPNLTFVRKLQTSSISSARLFYDHENAYAFHILNKDSLSHKIKGPTTQITTTEEFDATLDQNWRGSSAEEIVKVFANVIEYCRQNNVAVSDPRFDKLVDGLMDHCENLSYADIVLLLASLCEYPVADSYTSHNFHDIWSCLDDICCWKMIQWDIEEMFVVADLWYRLSLGKFSDFVFVLTDRLCKKADSLTKNQLLKIFFYFNICRRRAVDFEYEYALEKQINNMNVDEMAVIAMGYFKTKTKIKLLPILSALVQQVTENSKSIHDISLTAILKIVRYSKPTKIVPQINAMLDNLSSEIDRFSDLCCLHIALIGTGIQMFHRNTVQKSSEKLVKNITDVEKVRLKDIERLLNVLSMFDFDPKTEPDIFKAAYKELHREERIKECIRYPRCLPCALSFLSLRNIYSYELMDRILDMDFIKNTYGKYVKSIPQVILSLDASIDIECSDYKGNRLPPSIRHKATKWLTDFTPTHEQNIKVTAADKLFLDTVDTVKSVVKNEKFIYIDHLLPHFSKADIVLCKDKTTGNFVEPKGLENYILGEVMFPPKDDGLEWFAMVVLGWNNTVRDSSLPIGHSIMKERQLRKIGYTPIFVIWNEFMRLPEEEKIDYVRIKLS